MVFVSNTANPSGQGTPLVSTPVTVLAVRHLLKILDPVVMTNPVDVVKDCGISSVMPLPDQSVSFVLSIIETYRDVAVWLQSTGYVSGQDFAATVSPHQLPVLV